MSGIVNTVKDSFFGGAEKKAGEAQLQASREGVAEQRRQFDITRQDLQPFLEAGQGAIQQQQALLGLLGPEKAAQAFQTFEETPGQRFLRERQEKALLRNASAIGGLGGGNVRSALQEQAAGIASTQFGDFQNRLAALSGSGQSVGTNLGQLGGQTAGNISNLLQAGGQARASGILGRSEGIKSGLQSLAGAFI